MHFRQDINGLRAVAVLAVMLFHYHPEWLPGGFAGVDVFFVISGFLMTSIVVSGVSQDTFSVLSFYRARAKRIIPALTVSCAALLAAGWFFITPIGYAELGKHVASSLTFVSNIVYWQEAGYFDAASTKKWLLHTWSLSVEWQFYLLYPLLIVAIYQRASVALFRHIILILTVIAFVANLYLSYSAPSASYFLLTARAWEMFAGGLVYLYPLNLQKRSALTIALTGLLLIAGSYIWISEDNVWPGSLALIPVAGAVLLIAAKSDHNPVLNNAFMQAIGRWSYSIYLWHWIVVVANTMYHWSMPFWLYCVVVTVCGAASYQLVEKRRHGYLTLALYLVTLAASLWLFLQQGAPSRVPEKFRHDADSYHHAYYGGAGYRADEWIHFNSEGNDADIVITGDSYSLQYARVIEETGIRALGRFYHGCPILPHLTKYEEGKELEACSRQYQTIADELQQHNKPVILAQSWDSYQDKIMEKGSAGPLSLTEQAYNDRIIEELTVLIQDWGEREYVLVGVPQKAWINAFECLARQSLAGSALMDTCSSTQPESHYTINTRLAAFAREHDNVHYVHPNDSLCTDGMCQVIDDGEPMHSDRSHLSVFGARKVFPAIMAPIRNNNG